MDNTSSKSDKKNIEEFKKELENSNPQELLPEVEKKKEETVSKLSVPKKEESKEEKGLEIPKVYAPKTKKQKPKVKMSERLSEEKIVKLLSISIIAIVVISSLVGYLTFKSYSVKKFIASNSSISTYSKNADNSPANDKGPWNVYSSDIEKINFTYPNELNLIEQNTQSADKYNLLQLEKDSSPFMKISYYINSNNLDLDKLGITGASENEATGSSTTNSYTSALNESVIISGDVSAILQKNRKCDEELSCHRYLIPVKGRIYEILFFLIDKQYVNEVAPKILTSLSFAN